jgi:hypothetical protein
MQSLRAGNRLVSRLRTKLATKLRPKQLRAQQMVATSRISDSEHSQSQHESSLRQQRMANVWLFGCLGLAAFLGIRSFVATQTEAGPSVQTDTVAAKSGRFETRIEDLRVGERLASVKNPGEDFDDSLGDEVDAATWRKLTLKARKDDGTFCDIELLRPTWWIEEQSARTGAEVYVSVPECGIDDFAEVLAIESCPTLEEGKGPVVTGTFAHQSAEVINIHVEGLDEPIGTTTNHPFWSDTRQDFIAAGDLHPGERLHGIQGNPRITKILPRGPPEPVYNIEVFGEHVYQVSSSGLLVHNGGPCPNNLVSEVGLPNGRTLNLNRGPRGGTYAQVRAGRPGGEVHHLPMKQAWKDAGHPAGAGSKAPNGPAIHMTYKDHRALPSTRGQGAALQAQQTELIRQGKIDDAFLLGVEEIQAIHGNKYDDVILEAINAMSKFY